MTEPIKLTVADEPLVTLAVGTYENHHLLCPRHGRTAPTGDGTASCGCTPVILWHISDWGEHPPLAVDNLTIGRRYA